MITIAYSTRTENPKHKKHLIETCQLKNVEVIEIVNNGEKSLAQCYNEVLKSSKHDINVYLHDDVKLSVGWGKKLLKDFEDNPDYGIIGKAGSCYFPESGVYWEKMQQTLVGQVYHEPEGQKKYLSKYSLRLPYLIPVVTIDGLFIAFDKTKIKHTFDETIGKFHFYDHAFCLPNYLAGVKIGVTTSFEITHNSVGKPNEEFYKTKEVFLEKYGEELPLDLKPEKVYVEHIKEKPLKHVGKVAVIIPTKGKLNLLFDCLDSFAEHCNKDLYEIFIADTGSNDTEIKEIEGHIKEIEGQVTINLIKYDYYNFAKINNDVVRNHVGNSFEFLLFCNNDIKLLNNVLYGMLKIFKTTKNVGTVGCRLHYEDNTVQHNGVVAILDKENNLHLTHKNIRAYYNYQNSTHNVFGNTGGLMMIKKEIFEKCGHFNEEYINCFEDVELNAKCMLMGLNNFNDGSLVAYHYESQSRNDDQDNLKKESIDFKERLNPFIRENLNKLIDKKLFLRIH